MSRLINYFNYGSSEEISTVVFQLLMDLHFDLSVGVNFTFKFTFLFIKKAMQKCDHSS